MCHILYVNIYEENPILSIFSLIKNENIDCMNNVLLMRERPVLRENNCVYMLTK